MKEKMCNYFENFCDNLERFCDHPAVENICENEFVCGMFCGIGVYLVIVLLVHLVFIICRRRKKCAELIINTSSGNIAVSLKAVTAALKTSLASFSQLEIVKILIYRKKSNYLFEIRGKFIPGVSGAPELYAALERDVKENMKNIFGVENISQVDLRIEGCSEKENTKPESDGFIDAVM